MYAAWFDWNKGVIEVIETFNGGMFTISADDIILIKILVPFPLIFAIFWHPGPHWVNQMSLFRLLLLAKNSSSCWHSMGSI